MISDMFGNRIPKWVRNLPGDSTDKELLMQLIGASKKPLDTPREINFVIMDLPNRETAENAATQVEQRGWSSWLNPDPYRRGIFHLEAKKENYEITETLLEDEAFMARIANLYTATYDGWYAKVV